MVYNADFSVPLYYFIGIQRMLALLVLYHLPENLFVFAGGGVYIIFKPVHTPPAQVIPNTLNSICYRECLIWAEIPQIFPDPQNFN